jgi:UDPglucose 6-dehydrogenase
MNITVVGTGYVGIVTAVGLCALGHRVHCIDVDENKIKAYKNGNIPIYEIGLQEKINVFVSKGKLTFSTNFIENHKVFFIAVGTPPLKNGDSDLSYLFTAIDQINMFASKNSLIVVKSTVPIGTNKKILKHLKNNKKRIQVASNPEFLREGNAINDFLAPDRIIIGATNKNSLSILASIYAPLVIKNGVSLLKTDPNTAELIKHSSNAYLANKIAFINELSDLCEKAGANVKDLSVGIGLDKRIGKDFLKVGPGFGGSCFPKDIGSLNMSFKKYGIKSSILEAIIFSNEVRFKKIVKKIINILNGVQNKVLCILGLTFKANTDDTRESPSIKIIELLLQHGAKIQAYDPKAKLYCEDLPKKIELYNNPKDAMNQADAIIIATEWEEFKSILYSEISNININKNNIIIDLRNLLEVDNIKKGNFQYYCLGIKNKKLNIKS